jgi:hypothetical protein
MSKNEKKAKSVTSTSVRLKNRTSNCDARKKNNARDNNPDELMTEIMTRSRE